MTAPVVAGSATSATATASTNHVLDWTGLGTVAAGDLILILMDTGAQATLNAHGSYTELLDENQAHALKILYRWATGGETAPTLVSSIATRDATITYRITGASIGRAPVIGATAATNDPPSITPAGGPKDFLAIAMVGNGAAAEQADDGTYVSAWPTGFTDNRLMKTCGIAGSNLGGMVGACTQATSGATTINPGTFTTSDTTVRTQTIAVYPAYEAAVAIAATADILTAGTVIPGPAQRAVALDATAAIASAGAFETPGALAATVDHQSTGDSLSTFVSPSATPVNGALYLVFTFGRQTDADIGAHRTPTLTGTNGWNTTWNRVAAAQAIYSYAGEDYGGIECFWGIASSGVAGTFTVAYGSPNLTSHNIHVIRITGGPSMTAPVGVTGSGNENTAAASTVSATLTGTPAATSIVVAVAASDRNTGVMTAGANYTLLGSLMNDANAPVAMSQPMYDQAPSSTAVAATFTGGNDIMALSAVEIVIAGAIERAAGIDATVAIAVAQIRVHLRAGALDAAASIAAGRQAELQRQAAIAATSGILAAQIRVHLRAAAVDATAAIAAAQIRLNLRAAALDAAAAIAVAGFHEVPRAAAIDAAAAIAVAGQVVAPGVVTSTAAIDATAGIISAPFKIALRQGALDATAGIAAGRFAIMLRQAVIDAAAAIASASVHEALRSAAIAATGDIAAQGHQALVTRTAAIDATASIVAAPFKIAFRQAAISATGDIATAGEISGAVVRSVAISATADVTAAPQRYVLRAVALPATAAVGATGRIAEVFPRAAALDGSPALSAAGITLRARAASLDATAAVAGDAYIVHIRTVMVDGAATFEVVGQRDLLRVVIVSALAEVEAAGEVEGEIERAAELLATATITVAGESYNPTEDWDLPPPQSEWPVSVGAEWSGSDSIEWPMPKTGG